MTDLTISTPEELAERQKLLEKKIKAGMSHEFKRKTKGAGKTQAITTTCSCGWVGNWVVSNNFNQPYLIQLQEEFHLREVARNLLRLIDQKSV